MLLPPRWVHFNWFINLLKFHSIWSGNKQQWKCAERWLILIEISFVLDAVWEETESDIKIVSLEKRL